MQKKQPKVFYLTGMLELDRAYSQEMTMRQQRDVLDKCGLTKQAREVDRRIMEHQAVINRIRQKVMQQRDDLVRAMLLGFCAADIATTCADRLGETFDRHTVGTDNEGGNYIATLIRMQAEEWNKCVQLIDGDGVNGSERVSMYYSELAEDVVARVLPVMLDTINEYMTTDKGKRLL